MSDLDEELEKAKDEANAEQRLVNRDALIIIVVATIALIIGWFVARV